MALRCQPAEPLPPVALPPHLRLWGVDSGIRHRCHSRFRAWLDTRAMPRFSSNALPLDISSIRHAEPGRQVHGMPQDMSSNRV